MSDLINRHNLTVKLCGGISCNECPFNVIDGESGCLLDKRLYEQPSAESEQRWIPCKERMPVTEEKVWIQTRTGKVCFAMYEDGTLSETDSSWYWYDLDFEEWDDENDCGIIPEGWWEFTQFHPDCEFDCPVDEKVIAWMPLPESYKEQGEAK